jgi:putative ABC transport system permease protein
MNLAWRDIRHKLGRFVLTCLGLSLLLAVVITMAAMNRGQIEDATALVQAIGADLWVVEAHTVGPFAESSRIPSDTREIVARINGVAEAGSITLQNVQLDRNGRKLRLQVVGYEPGRPGGPVNIAVGREITRSHYEMIADRQTGLKVGDTVHLGRNDYTVVGETAAGRPAAAVRAGASGSPARGGTGGAARANRSRQCRGGTARPRCPRRGGS